MLVDDMPAGREMDTLMAEKVVGWTVITIIGFNDEDSLWLSRDGQHLFLSDFGMPLLLPRYSTDIAAVWEVVEKIDNGRRDRYPTIWHDKSSDLWVCEFGTIQGRWSETIPLAICTAALKAVGITEVP
jgi:hypothetical protein